MVGSSTRSAVPDRTAVAVLIADDDPTSRVLVAAALGEAFAAVEAENGLAAVQALERQRFDVAILDLDMPVMDGFGVIERARGRTDTRHLPIIVVTGRDDVVAIERAFALGATSFLCKPINWNIFRHQVGYVLQVARAEDATRLARDHAETMAAFRERAMAVLMREIAGTVATIADAAGAPGSSPAVAAAGERQKAALARVTRAFDILTGVAGLSPVRVNAGDIVGEAIARLRDTFAPDIDSRVVISAQDVPALQCDRALAAEALAEILRNALAFSGPGGIVRLAVVAAAPDRVRFEVVDRGPGIAEDVLEAGFAAFGPGSAGLGPASLEPAGRSPAALGLGLPMAKAIAEQHGGHLGVMSELGRGTEVFLSFPTAPQWRQGERSLSGTARLLPTTLSDAAPLSAS